METNHGRPGWGRAGESADGATTPSAPNLRRRRRSAWNPATWTPVTSSFAANRNYRAPGTPGGRSFAPTEHLAAEAIAAFVDGELRMSAHGRAAEHLAVCPECLQAVDAQIATRARLRASGSMDLPAGLLGALSNIPTQEIDLAATERLHAQPVHGTGMAPDGPVRGRPAALDNSRDRLTRRWGR